MSDMHAYLSAEWHAAVVDAAAAVLPERPGATGALGWKVTGGPNGDVAYVQRIDNGRLASQQLIAKPEGDIIFTVTWNDAVALMKGELDPNVAVMQGRIKADGNMGALMDVLPVTGSDEYRSLQATIRQATTV
jgi:putative sterol carrier protein